MRILLLLLSLSLIACGVETKAKPYASLTKDEQAREALDAFEYETAIELYKELIEAEPEAYERYRFLAAAYAAWAGFDIIEVASGTFNGGSGSLLDSLGSLLPADPTAEQFDHMGLAKDALLSIPAEMRSKANADIAYAAGAAVQLEFYQTAYSIMYINRFAKVTANGTLDRARLETMTEADVINILENFSQVAANGGEGVPVAAQKILSQIEEQPGASSRDKLISYLNSHNS